MTDRALLLHGGPGVGDYLGPLEDELAPLFDVTRYTQGRHLAFGHFPWLERPGLVHDAVVDFLASRSS